MADLKTTVDLIFRGVDNASGKIDQVLKNVNKYNQGVNAVATPLADVTKRLLAAEAAAIGLAAVFAKQAYNASIDFSRAQVELAKVLDDSEGPVSQYNEAIFDLSEQYGVTAQDAVRAAADFRQSGFTTSESLDLVQVALRAVVAGQVEAGEASSQLRAILAAFGGDASDAATVIDLLNEASNNYNARFDELLIAFQRFAPIAAQTNLSFQETLAVLTPVVEVFQRGEMAGTALSSIFNQLQSDQTRVTETLEALGVAQTDANGNIRSQRDIYFDLLPALESIDAAQRSVYLAQLAGLEQSPKLAAAFSGLVTTNEILSESFDFVGSAADETNRVLEGAPKAADRATAAWQNFLISFGNKYQSDIGEFNNALAGVFQTLREGTESGSLDPLADQLSGLFDTLTDKAEQLAAVLPEALALADFSGFADGVTVLIGEFGEFEITAEGVAEVITQVGRGFETLSTFTRGVVDVLAGFVAIGAEIVDVLLAIDQDAIKVAGTIGGLALAYKALSAPIGVAIGLLRDFNKLASGLLPLLGPVGLVGAAGAAGFAFGSLLDRATGLSGAVADLAAEVTGLADRERALLAPTDAVTAAQSAQLAEFQSLTAEYQALLARGESLTPELVNQAKAFEDTGKAVNLTREEFDALLAQQEVEQRMRAISEAAVEQGGAMEETASKADLLKQAQQGLIPLTDELIEYWRGGPAQAGKLSEATGTLAEQLDAMAESGEVGKDKIAELRTELEKEEIRARVEFEIAQLEQDTERVKARIQGVVDLAQIKASVDIAEIEAGVEKTRAVLQGLQGVFDVTGNSISELIDAISGVDDADRFARQKIETFQNALDRQITLQEAALESQIKVNDATVRELEARASRLRSGQSLITITGDGLEPELEAFMFRILENIQLRANADGQAFLLGI